jgi:hypothetical protein
MSVTHSELSFLADLPLYEKEKPFLVLLPPDAPLDPSVPRSNLLYETHKVSVHDIRNETKTVLEESGFQVLSHKSSVTFADDIYANEFSTVQAYKNETEELLKTKLGAVHVICYDFRVSFHCSLLLMEIEG